MLKNTKYGILGPKFKVFVDLNKSKTRSEFVLAKNCYLKISFIFFFIWYRLEENLSDRNTARFQ